MCHLHIYFFFGVTQQVGKRSYAPLGANNACCRMQRVRPAYWIRDAPANDKGQSPSLRHSLSPTPYVRFDERPHPDLGRTATFILGRDISRNAGVVLKLRCVPPYRLLAIESLLQNAMRPHNGDRGMLKSEDDNRLESAPPPPMTSKEGAFAWLQCAGAFCLFFNSWGLVNAFGTKTDFADCLSADSIRRLPRLL